MEPAPIKAPEKLKKVQSFNDRKFIYTNGITIKSKEENIKDEKGVKVLRNYPVIWGLENKEIQDKLNKEFQEVEKGQLAQLETKLYSVKANSKAKINQKTANAYITYNCNNVIFVDYHTFIDARLSDSNYNPTSSYISYGYDLNTGERIKFDDLFIPGSNYKEKINNFISQYIIENNYDDYEYDSMTKPFQGIREDQSFSFGVEGLLISFDERNDEFVSYGYPVQIRIPLKYIGDDIYIFDKYFDADNSIFIKKKLSKTLLPNNIELTFDNLIREENNKYNIWIAQGKFSNIPDKEIEKRLNDLITFKGNLEDIRKEAKELPVLNKTYSYTYGVNVQTNAGNYLSGTVTESRYFNGNSEVNVIPFNYDFNTGKELKLEDMFESTVDIEAELKKQALRMGYPMPADVLDNAVNEAIKVGKFTFHEYGVNIYIPIKDAKIDNMVKWVWIPFESLNENDIKLFK
jgi:hypothetical protein